MTRAASLVKKVATAWPWGGDAVGVGALEAFDEPLEAQPAQVVGRLSRPVGGVDELGHVLAQRGVGQPAADVIEGCQRREQPHDAGFAEPQRGCALAVVDRGQHHLLQHLAVGQFGHVLAEGGEEAGVDVRAGVAQRLPVRRVQRLAQVEVVGVVDGGLHPQRPPALEVGLDKACSGYSRDLSAIRIEDEPEQISETIEVLRRQKPPHLRKKDRRKVEKECASKWVAYVIENPAYLGDAYIGSLERLLDDLHAPGSKSDDIYQKIMLARLRYGAWPLPRYVADIATNAEEIPLLCENVSEEVEETFLDSLGDERIRMRERLFRIEVTTKRLAVIDYLTCFLDLERIVAISVRGSWVSVRCQDSTDPIDFRSNVAELIRETILEAREQTLR